MSETAVLAGPAQQFINDMTAVGASARADGPRILYDVVAVGGDLSGQTVTTGVSVSELQSWPMVPPHWIHLPESIAFAATNVDEVDCPPGWKRHSREYTHNDMSVPPALSWLRHVRGFISIAIPKAA
ncbi:hypothetical protein [Paenarthrobacter histidinolovorans]|uniref:hypothetical protein n=1 Tax=Paenarthrobacter histidinolovorans TaxID=43664 RepID=UPI00166E9B72|nr:hypothetical protein [Paenarthrobacter histidinolovorans]GGJ36237.1 hypothetical protein GCM10010052_36690 [Paenarthrobacter histidinolovorans]